MEWTRGAIIGRGSTAAVYLASGLSSGDIFAVKSTELSLSKLLRKEQSFLSKLNSPHVVKYMGFDITNENDHLLYNLFMEYLPRGTLRDEIRRQGGKLDETKIRRYTWDILHGLEYLHSNGLVHCDVKSSNILMGSKNVKISDLGCATTVGEVTGDGNSGLGKFSGTPVFMAPEVVRREEQGFEADIWALGCTVIEMATGKNPWPEVDDPLSALYRIGFSDDLPEFPSWFSLKAKDFLGICLKRDPKQRMAATELLKHPFFEELRSETEQMKELVASTSSSSSPKSVFDQNVWDSFDEENHEVSSLSSASERIERLVGDSVLTVSNWSSDQDWITVRSNVVEESDDELSDINDTLEMSFLGVHLEELNVNTINTVKASRKRCFLVAFGSVEIDIVPGKVSKQKNEKISSVRYQLFLSPFFF
ncbi:mitogen-activated protein kinase kinase kinase 17-like [Humulus lupulus]|uniref:mitogen-activated protein kinase kinase kinase 17-like n=1 Tax=Humulus lupulus TaxID=3486 RepID=UPI002B409556|nr:mitogen-activated protein kinase kinase kinase 17-like [Humulus lupulus]